MTSNSICDKNGKIILLCNGIQLKDAQDRFLDGGDNKLVPDNNYIVDYQLFHGLKSPDGTLLLPIPDTECVYTLFHWNMRVSNDPRLVFVADTLYMSTIKKKDDRYYFSEFRKKILVDTIEINITATKHANGKDWWVVVPGRLSNRLNVVKLTKDGATHTHTQYIGKPYNDVCGGQTKFTPDGTKYIWHTPCDGLHIKDFDRRTGRFCNPIYLPPWDYVDGLWGGLECSPNSRYIYPFNNYAVWQLDLTSKNILKSKIKVAELEKNTDNSSFSFAQLAPNNKIYISSSNKYYHVIHKPNLKGEQCDLRQNDLELPTFCAWAIPNFPNFRLGPMDIDVRPNHQYCLSLSTNPVVDRTDISTDFDYGAIQIFDIAGKLIQEYGRDVTTLDISQFPSGMYIVTLLSLDNKKSISTKLVKL
ncbi:MAG: T9SS type A sorting domain-containing protein [Saprospiraceae bacterium]